MSSLQRIRPELSYPLHDTAATRRIEATALAGLAPGTLMQRAGAAVARLTLALAPHARTIWVACGPGNNGGDGIEAAVQLRRIGKDVRFNWHGSDARASADTQAALRRARAAGLSPAERAPDDWDFAIDALLGIGPARPGAGPLVDDIDRLRASTRPVLAIDLPSGLDADTGRSTFEPASKPARGARHTLSLLTLKPGLFTAQGRDLAGQVWLDTLGLDPDREAATARLLGCDAPNHPARAHDSHKGSHGDVCVIGGAGGLTGAALLAARAALHHGAGRVYVGLLDGAAITLDAAQPELMLRDPATLDLNGSTVVAGCGGADMIAGPLPRVLSAAPRLVLDADALNAIARDTSLRQLLRARADRSLATVATPHPLEAARLLGVSSDTVQADRLRHARELAQGLACVVVLKGSGSIVAAPDGRLFVNPTGNARLASAGTGDVLAGMVAAGLARHEAALAAACSAVWWHGWQADGPGAAGPLLASRLAAGPRG